MPSAYVVLVASCYPCYRLLFSVSALRIFLLPLLFLFFTQQSCT